VACPPVTVIVGTESICRILKKIFAMRLIPSLTVREDHLEAKSMRHILQRLVLIACIVIPCWAGAETQKAKAKITIDALSFDFNDVMEGTAVDHTFRVVNTGDGVLRIKQIKTS